MKVCILCSPGGHMTEALSVLEAFDGHDVFLMTNKFPTVDGFAHKDIKNVYYLKFFGFGFVRTMLTCLYNSLLCIKIFVRERPSVIFSTGSDITVPAFYLGKLLFRCKLVYLESLTRVHTASLNARAVYWISDLFLVQWEQLLSVFGKKAQFTGRLL